MDNSVPQTALFQGIQLLFKAMIIGLPDDDLENMRVTLNALCNATADPESQLAQHREVVNSFVMSVYEDGKNLREQLLAESK